VHVPAVREGDWLVLLCVISVPPASSPEVIVWWDVPSPGRYLFRSRPEDMAGVPLAGVWVQTLRSRKEAWTSPLPPIPALA
jgi:hypothetical protein